MSDDAERIRRRAYDIWLREGRPEGRDDQHWQQASREIQAEGKEGRAPAPVASAPDEAPAPVTPEAGAASARGAAAAAAVDSARSSGQRERRPKSR